MHPRQYRLHCFATVGLVLALGAARPAAAQDYGRRPLWVAPARLFAIDIAPGWQVLQNEHDVSTVEFRPGEPGIDASLFIRRLKVPVGAHPRQLMLNALEERLRKLPGFQEGRRRDVRIGGLAAAAIAGVYYFQGNIQYPRTVEEIFLVRGEEAFTFHFECFEPLAPQLAPDLDHFYGSFVARPPAELGESRAPTPARREIVDPDRVVY